MFPWLDRVSVPNPKMHKKRTQVLAKVQIFVLIVEVPDKGILRVN
jgi:hypothetical protein